MTVCRYYLMTAKDDQIEALRTALIEVGAKVRELEGSEGVELYQDTKAPTRFHFLEHWASVDAHRAAGQILGKEAFAAVLAAVAEPPPGSYLNPISL
jgi:quinol monooxygenase YgiN